MEIERAGDGNSRPKRVATGVIPSSEGPNSVRGQSEGRAYEREAGKSVVAAVNNRGQAFRGAEHGRVSVRRRGPHGTGWGA